MKLKKILYAAVIAAVYAALTLIFAPISMGPVQCRVSEALCVLPMLSPVAIPGLFVGCLIVNIFLGSIYDIVFGSLATLAAAYLTWRFRKNRWLATFFPVIFNAVIVGGYLGLFLPDAPAVWFCMLTVGIGEAISCYGIGLALFPMFKKLFARLYI